MGTQGELFQVALHQFGPDLVLSLSGEVTFARGPALQHEFDRALGLAGEGHLVIDMAGIEFLGSRGLDVVIRAAARAKIEGVTVLVQDPPQMYRGLFDILELSVVDSPVPLGARQAVPALMGRPPWERPPRDRHPTEWATSRTTSPS